MTLFRVSTRIAFRGSADAYKWSHLWYIEANDVNTAAIWGQSIAFRLVPALSLLTFVYEIYATDLDPESQNFAQIAMGNTAIGTFATSGELYHSSACMRVNLNVPNSRPSRKFHRVPFGEGEVVQGLTVTSGMLNAINAAYQDIFTDISALRDESGNTFTSVAPDALTTRRLGRDARNDVPPTPAA